jgi:transcriptional regulator with XRE-family HTH domain
MKELGRVLGCGESTISMYENGKRQPDNETLKKIADYYGVTIDYLLGYEQQAPPPTETLTDGEKALLDLFKRVPSEQQSLVLEMIKVALQTSK